MHKYKVVLEGRGAVIEVDDVATKCGFFTTRYISAESVYQAEMKAISLVREELALRVANQDADSVQIAVDHVEELESFHGCLVPGKGFSFYLEDD